MINTALSPNTQNDDFSLAIKTLLNPSGFHKGPFPQKVREWFKTFLGIQNVTLYESARTGMYFALKEMGVGEEDEVLIQAFTCVAAVNPIKWTGAKPVFVDIDPHNFNMDIVDLENKITERTKVIIVQHTFGYPAELDEIQKIAAQRGIKILEDCSHTIGTEYKGKKLGTIGDVGVYSLGRDKAVSASFGGVVVTRDESLGQKLETVEQFLTYPAKKWILQELLFTISTYLAVTLNDVFVGRVIHALAKHFTRRESTTKGEKKSGDMPAHARSRLPNALARVAYHQLQKLPRLNRLRHEFTNQYIKQLSKLDDEIFELPAWRVEKNTYPIRYPVLVKDPVALRQYAWQHRVMLGDWYDVPVAPRGVDQIAAGYSSGSCPNAEGICKRIVNLPLHLNLAEQDVYKIVSLLKDFYGL